MRGYQGAIAAISAPLRNPIPPFPVTVRKLQLWLVDWVVMKGNSPNSLQGYYSHLKLWVLLERDEPWPDGPRQAKILASTRRALFKINPQEVRRAVPLGKSFVHAASVWCLSRALKGSLLALQTVAWLNLAFECMLRPIEYSGGAPSEALRLRHLEWSDDNAIPHGRLWIQYGKATVGTTGVTTVFLSTRPAYRYLRLYLRQLALARGRAHCSADLLFPQVDPRGRVSWAAPMGKSAAKAYLRVAAAGIGYNPEDVVPYGLRSGGATDLLTRGHTSAMVARVGRWRSEAVLLYMRPGLQQVLELLSDQLATHTPNSPSPSLSSARGSGWGGRRG